MKWSSFKYLVKQGWHNMVANRLMTLASMGVLTACLFITGIAALLSFNVNSFVDYLGSKNEVVFFLSDTVTADQVSALAAQIKGTANVASSEYISKAQAVEEMKGSLGENSDLLDSFSGEGNPSNPLPASFRVSVADPAGMEGTVSAIKALGGDMFYKVEAPSELGNAMVSLRRVANLVGWGLVAVLGIVSVVVINNTIKLTVFARRKEINIMKFVGATNAFIRLPFFVEGMTVGALSGVVATLLVGGGYYALDRGISQSDSFSVLLNEFSSCMLPFKTVILPLAAGFMAFGMLIGSTGCATSIRKHLKV